MSDLDKLISIKYNNIKPAQGKILLSEPFLRDYYFKRSVVLLADHSAEGSFGLIINKPIEVRFSEVIKDFPDFKAPIYLGGPVKTDSLFFIHTLGDKIENSTAIMDGLFWGGDIDTVKEMITLHQITANEIRFFIGYSGWDSKQLDKELEVNSWVVTKVRKSDILNTNPLTMWSDFVKKLGKNYAYWVNFPVDPAIN